MDGHGDFTFKGWHECDGIDGSTFQSPIDFFKTQILDRDLIRNFFMYHPVVRITPDLYLVPCIDGEFDFGLAIQLADILEA